MTNTKQEGKKKSLQEEMNDDSGNIENVEIGKDKIVVHRKDINGKKVSTTYNKSGLELFGLTKENNLFTDINKGLLHEKIMFGKFLEDPEKIQLQIDFHKEYINMLTEYKKQLKLELRRGNELTLEERRASIQEFREKFPIN